jgi:enamine deaminase RidA (YjgF/YER057c/UK114 family)
MTKKSLSLMMEWLRPVGIGLAIYFAYYLGKEPISQFHIMGPFVVMFMSGTVAFESLILGEVASEKIGYEPNRAYQIQSGLANAATAITALLVYVLDWGRYADATIVTAMLMFFTLSAANHLATAIMERNMKPVNLLRPAMALLLIGFLLPPMIKALTQ